MRSDERSEGASGTRLSEGASGTRLSEGASGTRLSAGAVRTRLEAADAVLLVVDVQERLMPAMAAPRAAALERSLGIWAEAAPLLGIPIVVTEQYPKGLGPTVPWLEAALPGVVPLPKTSFDALGDPAIAQALEATGRTQVLVAGVETHVCVLQTVRSVVARGLEAWVLEDATASRTLDDHQIGLARMTSFGAVRVSTELAVFDLLGTAEHPAFRAISRRVK